MKIGNEIPNSLTLYNRTLKWGDYLYIICAISIIYIILSRIGIGLLTIFLLVLVIYTFYRIYKIVKDRDAKIIIDRNGITFCEDNDSFKWTEIKFAYLKPHKVGLKRVVTYFHVVTNNGEFLYKMTNIGYNEKLLKLVIEQISGRNISDLSDIIEANTKKVLNSNRNLNEISRIFESFYKRQFILVFLLMFGLIGISIYIQSKFDFPYIFAIGFSLTMIILYIVEKIEEKRLRSKEFVSELDEDKFQLIKKEYEVRNDTYVDKNRRIRIFILLLILALGIFGISYMLDKDKKENLKTEKINSLPNSC